MRTGLPLAAAVTALALGAATGRAQPGSTACRPADERGRFIPNAMLNLVTTTDPNVISSRLRLQLPKVDPTQVALVTENRICSKAASAYAADITRNDGVTPSGQVYVVKVGTVYVVADPAEVFGERILAATLSSNYKVLARFQI